MLSCVIFCYRTCGDSNVATGTSGDVTPSVYQTQANSAVVTFVSGSFPNGKHKGLRLTYWSISAPGKLFVV